MPKLTDGRLALGLFAAFAFWLFAVLPFLYGPPPRFAKSSSPPQTHSEEAGQQSAAKPDGTATAPFFIRIPKTAKEESEEASDRHEKSSTDRWLMIFTGAVALFTLLLVAATVMLYFAGEKQLRLASATSERQSDEMLKSIAVANRAAAVAEKALVATDRAWISIKAEIIGPLVFDQDHVRIGIGFDMTNIGKSPATNLELHAYLCCDIIAAKEMAEKSADLTRYLLLDYGVVLFPGETREDDWLELQMPRDAFMKGIEESMAQVAESKNKNESGWDGSINPAIMVCARYRLAGSVSRHHTIILFEIKHMESSHFGWDGSEVETNLVLMKLVQTFMSGQVT